MGNNSSKLEPKGYSDERLHVHFVQQTKESQTWGNVRENTECLFRKTLTLIWWSTEAKKKSCPTWLTSQLSSSPNDLSDFGLWKIETCKQRGALPLALWICFPSDAWNSSFYLPQSFIESFRNGVPMLIFHSSGQRRCMARQLGRHSIHPVCFSFSQWSSFVLIPYVHHPDRRGGFIHAAQFTLCEFERGFLRLIYEKLWTAMAS